MTKAEVYSALERAIQDVLAFENEGDDPAPMVLTDFVVLVARQGYAESGEGFSAVSWILRDGDMPWWKIVGVVRSGLLRIEHQLATAEGTDFDA